MGNSANSLWDFNNEELFFEELFKEWYAPLCRTTYRIVRDQESAEDIVQDVFVKLWEKRNEIEVDTSMKSYLFKTCINTALNHYQKNKKKIFSDISNHEDSIKASQKTDVDIQFSELEKCIHQAIDTLPPACKEVFILSRFEEMKYKEIAEILNISVKTVENQMGKALKIMREQLGDYLTVFIFLINILLVKV